VRKDKILEILNEFEDYKKFLELVARQRLETTYIKDIENEEVKEPSERRSSMTEQDLTVPIINELKYRDSMETRYPGLVEIVWTTVVLLAFIWNFCYLVFAFCFDLNVFEHSIYLIIDIMTLIVYAIDVIVQVFLTPLYLF
jgi:hypothetical protein